LEICDAECVGVAIVKTTRAIPIPRFTPSGQGLVGAVSHKDEADPSNNCVFHRQCVLAACTQEGAGPIRCILCENR
jgi:hypothetical protein